MQQMVQKQRERTRMCIWCGLPYPHHTPHAKKYHEQYVQNSAQAEENWRKTRNLEERRKQGA